jgi:6-phosphogluconolactonase
MHPKLLVCLLLIFTVMGAGLIVVAEKAKPGESLMLYIGTYTDARSKGIYGYRFQPDTGKATLVGLMAETECPSFLVVHPNGRFLFAANEVSTYEGRNGYVSTFSIEKGTGQLELSNRVSSEGATPCHIAIDKTGKWLLTANYGSGSVAVFPIGENGKLAKASVVLRHKGSSVDPRRQDGPHAHSVNFSPDNRFLLVSDLGIDKLMLYRFDAVKGTVKQNDPPFIKMNSGAGPRHLAFHPNGHWVYQINELNSTITALNYNRDLGNLSEVGTVSTLPAGFSGKNTAAEIWVHPDGKFVYGSNRGHDSIAVFAVKGKTGMLESVEYIPTQGRTPRHFAIDPTGGYLFAANQNSDGIALFRIDRKTGRLNFTGTVLQVPVPVCVVFN